MTTEEKINDLLTRGVGTFVDPQGKFKEKLLKKANGDYSNDIVIKFGIDPTRPDIHLGHAVVLRKLRLLQDLGCKVIFLIGDFTALIGDPTGKSKARPEIDQAEAARNVATYIAQIHKILKIEPVSEAEKKEKITRDENKFIVDSPWFGWIRNADWFYGVNDISTDGLSNIPIDINSGAGNPTRIEVPANTFVAKAALYESTRMQSNLLRKPSVRSVSLVNVLAVLRHISHSQLIERDMFQQRIEKNEPLFMNEMLYPVFQGIDSDVIAEIYGSCDLEIGGTDQTFNMLMGRKVLEMTKKEPQAVLSIDLLVGTDGKEKMSKSLDNYIGISDEPHDIFGKTMSIPDKSILNYYKLCTSADAGRISGVEASLKDTGTNPRDIKLNLAQEIVAMYHGEQEAVRAKEVFLSTFQKKEIPDDIEEIKMKEAETFADLLLGGGIVSSKSDWRRLVEEGAVKRIDKKGEEDKITNYLDFATPGVYKIGKRRFVKIT